MENWITYKNDLTGSGNSSNHFPKSGKITWTFDTAGEVWTDPIIVHQFVLVGCQKGFFYCLDKISGNLLWKYDLNEKGPRNAVANNETVYFGAGNFIFALDISTGNLKFKTSLGETTSFVSPRLIENKLVFGFSLSNLYFIAVDAITGSILWKYEERTLGDLYPAIINETDFIFPCRVTSSNECQLTCLDLESGIRKWHFKDKICLSQGEILSSYIHSTSPIIQNGVIYFASLGNLFLIDPESGLTLKSMRIPRSYRTHYQLTIHNNNIYFARNTDFVEFNLNKQVITNELISRAGLTAAIVSNNLMAFTSIRKFYIYNLITKVMSLEIKLPGTIYANPAYADGRAIVVTSDRKVISIE